MDKSADNGDAFGAVLTGLSEAFDCLSHELLIAKLDAYGFDKSSLRHSYLSNRKQRVKINYKYSSPQNEIIFGVPQGSILGPFFSIFSCAILSWELWCSKLCGRL